MINTNTFYMCGISINLNLRDCAKTLKGIEPKSSRPYQFTLNKPWGYVKTVNRTLLINCKLLKKKLYKSYDGFQG